ncbi:hypothetical protein AURDEDRAFT_127328 [Auricularia subglabra TFB-10046 SS5]|nr:hypothetical protein AURDEDRAFT_127328 [Auricularia subglabra TFB-10046 SS5]
MQTLDLRDLIGDDAEEAQAWMRDFKKHMLVHTLTLTAARLPEAHARAFPLHIAPGSEAETWWNGLTNAERGAWVNIQQQFDLRWPPVQARAVPITEHIDAFHAHIFDASEIDTRIPTGIANGTRNAHTVYAEKLKTLGNKSTLPDAALIRAATKQIPPAMAELMQPFSRQPWDVWCSRLGELDVEEIKAKQSFFDRLEALETHVTAPRPQYTPQRHTAPQPAPVQQVWQQAVQAVPAAQHAVAPPPKSAATVARAEQERKDWAARYPDGRVYASRQYPLSPGTAPAATGCTRCGEAETPSHTRYSCTAPMPLPELEQKYRANVKATLARAAQQGHPVPMTPGALGTPHGYATPARGRGQWSTPRGGFGGRGGWMGRGAWSPGSPVPATPSPLHQIEYEGEVDEEVEMELDGFEQGNVEEAA